MKDDFINTEILSHDEKLGTGWKWNWVEFSVTISFQMLQRCFPCGEFSSTHPREDVLVLQSRASLQDYLYFMFTLSSTLFHFCQSIIVLNYLLYLNLCLLLLSYKNRDSLSVLTLHIIEFIRLYCLYLKIVPIISEIQTQKLTTKLSYWSLY